MKKFLAFAGLCLLTAGAFAQTNLQVFYDFGNDREFITTTLEGFYNDNWGNTFFFIDYDYPLKSELDNTSPSGTYMEIARCLNFWQNSKLAPLSFQVEYNGGAYKGYGINHSLLLGLDWFMHSADFSNTLNLKVLYKSIKGAEQKVPMQFTAVWGMQDLFNVKGLRFSGFADLWWESKAVFISEPQLWYNVGQHFGCENLHLGTEIELSANFGGVDGFKCRPCLGAKWVF